MDSPRHSMRLIRRCRHRAHTENMAILQVRADKYSPQKHLGLLEEAEPTRPY